MQATATATAITAAASIQAYTFHHFLLAAVLEP